jgi:hypothetical protein
LGSEDPFLGAGVKIFPVGASERSERLGGGWWDGKEEGNGRKSNREAGKVTEGNGEAGKVTERNREALNQKGGESGRGAKWVQGWKKAKRHKRKEGWWGRETVDHVLRHGGRALWDPLEGSSRDRYSLQLGLMHKSVAVCVEGACEVGWGGLRDVLWGGFVGDVASVFAYWIREGGTDGEGDGEVERERRRGRGGEGERERGRGRGRGESTSMLLPKYALIIHTQVPGPHVELSSETDQSCPLLSSSPSPSSITGTPAAETKIQRGGEEGGEDTVRRTYIPQRPNIPEPPKICPR